MAREVSKQITKGEIDVKANFKVGDKVVMDRESDFFVEEMMELEDKPLDFWATLEDEQPLVIKSINEKTHNSVLEFERTVYMAESVWVKPYGE